MRTRSATRAAGLSPGREHVLPPPTRKKRAPRAKKESGEVPVQPPAAASEPSLTFLLNSFFPGATRASLLNWLYIFFLLFFLDAVLNQAAPIAPPAPAAPKRAAEDGLVGRPSVRRRLAPSAATPPPSKSGGAVRRLLAAVARPRPSWGLRKLLKPLSPIVEVTQQPATSPLPEKRASGTSMEAPSRKRQKFATSIAPEINTPRFEKHASVTPMETPSNPASTVAHNETTNPVTPNRKTRRHKRKRSPSPEVIPNPPGTSYGMWDKYFTYPSSSSEEESDVDVDMKDVTPTPDPATIRYPHNTSGEGVFCVNVDDILDAAEKEEAELAEKEAAELAEKEQTELAERQAAELAEKEQRELAEGEPAAIVPDALAKARALALKHKPETSSRLRFVERLSTSTVATDLNEEMGILTQAEKDEVSAAVAAIPEVDLIQFTFPRAPASSAAQDEIWRAVTAAAAGTPNKEVLPLFG